MKLTSRREMIWTLELTDNELAVLYNLLYGKVIDPDDKEVIDRLKNLFETSTDGKPKYDSYGSREEVL